MQYKYNSKLRVRSIGMIELERAHTATYLCDVIVRCLGEYNIDLHQIFTITTDNGRNMVKMIREIQKQLQELVVNAAPKNLEIDSESILTENDTTNTIANVMVISDDDAIEQLLLFNDITDDEAIEMIYEREEYQELDTQHQSTLSQIVVNLNESCNTIWKINGINCAAHTIQLAIKNALNGMLKIDHNIIELCRRISKILRLKRVQMILKEKGYQFKIPRLDVETRWSSTYMMVRKC